MTAGRLFTVSLIAAILCSALFFMLVPGLMSRAPQSFDARVGGYDLQQAQAYLFWLDTCGLLRDYQTTYRWIDSVFPVAIFGMLASAITGLWARPVPMIARLGVLVTFAYLIVDFTENAAIAAMLRAGVDVPEGDVAWASTLTQVKWVCLGAGVLLCLAGVALTLVKGGRR